MASAQRKVEGRNFDIRKSLLEFDDVANDQRKAWSTSATIARYQRHLQRPFMSSVTTCTAR
ncbi:hypothetical protein ACLK12_00555 [Escherichia coli]